MTNINNTNIKKILIHAPNWLGDIIMTIPAIKLIREKYKDAHIAILIKKSMASIFNESDIVNEAIDINDLKKVREEKFDVAIIFPNSFITALRIFRTGIKIRIGYTGDYRDFMLTHRVDRKPVRWINTLDYYVNMLKVLDIAPSRPILTLNVGENAKKIAKKYLKENNAIDKTIFAFGIGATNAKGKIWDEEYFATVMNTLQKKYDAKILFITTKNEKEISDNITSMLETTPLIPYYSLDIISAILSYSKGFIGNDSGAMHIASAVGITTLGLYFATPPYQNPPSGIKSDILVKQLPCAFCGGKKCKIKTFECRKVITPDEVISKFESMLNL